MPSCKFSGGAGSTCAQPVPQAFLAGQPSLATRRTLASEQILCFRRACLLTRNHRRRDGRRINTTRHSPAMRRNAVAALRLDVVQSCGLMSGKVLPMVARVGGFDLDGPV